MRVVVKNIGKIGVIKEINPNEDLNKIVGGWFQTYPLRAGMLIICNEEGKIKGLEPNVRIGEEIIVGNIAIVSYDEEDFTSLSDKQIEELKRIGLIE